MLGFKFLWLLVILFLLKYIIVFVCCLECLVWFIFWKYFFKVVGGWKWIIWEIEGVFSFIFNVIFVKISFNFGWDLDNLVIICNFILLE